MKLNWERLFIPLLILQILWGVLFHLLSINCVNLSNGSNIIPSSPIHTHPLSYVAIHLHCGFDGKHFKLLRIFGWKLIFIGKLYKLSRRRCRCRYFSHSLHRAQGSLSFNGVKWSICSCVCVFVCGCVCVCFRKAYRDMDKVCRSFDLNQSISFLYTLTI